MESKRKHGILLIKWHLSDNQMIGFQQSIDLINEKGGDVLLEALLGGGGGAIRGGQRHQAVAAPQVGLQSFLIGRLQALEELLRLPTEVTVKAPVTPATVEQEGGGKKKNTIIRTFCACHSYLTDWIRS